MENFKYGKDGGGTHALVHNSDQNRGIAISNLHVLITPEGNGFFAQAFEIDYGVQGDTIDQVKKRFEDGLAATIHHNLDIYGSIKNMLFPNQDWYAMKEEAEASGKEYDYSFAQWMDVVPKKPDLFSSIQYQAVRRAAA